VISEIFHALARRWYVLVAGALLTLGMAYGAVQATPPEHTARALVLLLPSESSVGPGGNPFLALSGLEQPAGILVAYFSSASARQVITDQAPNAEYEVAIDDSTRGPVIAVSVTDSSPEETLSTLNYIVDQVPIELARLQQQVDAPLAATIGSMPLTVDGEAERDLSGTIRLAIAAVVVGLVLTGVVAFALDGLILRRRLRRSSRSEPGAAVETTEEPLLHSATQEPLTHSATPVPARARREN